MKSEIILICAHLVIRHCIRHSLYKNNNKIKSQLYNPYGRDAHFGKFTSNTLGSNIQVLLKVLTNTSRAVDPLGELCKSLSIDSS